MSVFRWPLIAVIALSLIVMGSPASGQPSEEEVKERLETIGDEIRTLGERLADTDEARDEASESLRDVETALADTHRRLDELQAERRDLDERIRTLEEERDALQAERDDQVAELAKQFGALYRLGTSPELKLLLNQDDPARLDRLQTYLNHLARARTERLEEIAELDEELADNRETLQQRDQEMSALRDELDERSAELAERMEEREALVAKLDARYANESERLDALERDREDAEQLLSEVQEAMARLEEPAPSTDIERTQGDLPWPVQGEVSSVFGAGEGIARNGLVIQAKEGTAVHAVHEGRVVFADWMRGFGNLLILDHGDGVMTLHAHLQHFSVTLGDNVPQGETIGIVGTSGGRDTPALYFEVRRDGDPIDPQGWVANR
ncbi:murein hydrolase activator EnvC family protein [Aidingimonas halophila]|uniref:Septal ring factor EnvC, activator of murein hydrolases AmiA and AmiB n=1 Tax=Aidingimonas halophila TaxID=574349 RepID=A0A1H2XV01_9GAMM|nr:peptidoglycan DD-metalloendopeptidase family protein [Aidingimonas halophila]GHC29243.1 peptidase M23 [Aidingimonas halophila]SDW96284.1 Septal ring factor EnvC, activator of murein hydrolases AmiA and AmiB [Aidingimonas halophila]